MAGEDRFATAGLRRAVLDAWSANPDRLREDANAEEDLARGPYADRVVVELAQNAADAAARAGVPGRLLLRLDAGAGDDPAVLTAANTGAPLDAAGVRALASLRASAKRSGAGVGRFGVGSAAVLAVADDVTYRAREGDGVRFSRALTARALAQLPDAALAEQVAAREGSVPVLRLPWPVSAGDAAAAGAAGDGVPAGYETAVVLTLREARGVRAQLDALDDALLLALPALTEVVVAVPGSAPRLLARASERWHVLRRSGVFADGVLDALPVEERRHARAAGWSLTWALPHDAATRARLRAGGVVHAPTPTGEPLPWPALLVAAVPLAASRREVTPGPATDAVLAAAAGAYVDLLVERAGAGEDVLPLVLTGLGAGPVDAALREGVLAALPAAPVLAPVAGGAPLPPRRALVLDGAAGADPAVLAALAPLVPGLVRSPASSALLRALDVQVVALSEAVEAIAAPAPGAATAAWAAAVGALDPAAADPRVAEQLATLAVPLAAGRAARGARGLLLPAPGVPEGPLAVLARAGVRVVAARAAAEAALASLLARLGARPVSARALLEDPALAAAVLAAEVPDAADGADGPDGSGVEELSAAVLELVEVAVTAGELRPGDLPLLGEVLLRDDAGEVVPAAGLVLPGSPAAALLDPAEVGVVAPDLLARWGAGVLEAVGVARQLAVLRWDDVDPLDPPEDLADLDAAGLWLDDLADAGGQGALAAHVVAVRDLDLVPPTAAAALLAALAGAGDLRAAVVEPVRLVTPAGSVVLAPSLPATWLGRRLHLRGCPAPGAPAALARFAPPPPPHGRHLDPELARAVGMVSGWDDLDAAAWQRLVDAAGRPGGASGPGGAGTSAGGADLPALVDLLALWRALAAAAPSLEPPEQVLALDAAGGCVLVDAEDAVVADDPAWAQRTDLGARLVPGADGALALADVLDLDLASDRAAGRVDAPGAREEVPGAVLAALTGAPVAWWRHEELAVDGAGVRWWVTGRGRAARVHATDDAGLAAGLTLAAGAWSRRGVVEALLARARAAAGTGVGTGAGAGAVLVEEAAG